MQSSRSFGFLGAVKLSSWLRPCLSPDCQPTGECLGHPPSSRCCMRGRNETVEGPERSAHAMAGRRSGAQGGQHCASSRSRPWTPFFPGGFMFRTKGAVIARAAAAAARARGPGVVACCPPLSAVSQRLGPPLPSLTLPRPPLGFGPWPLLF